MTDLAIPEPVVEGFEITEAAVLRLRPGDKLLVRVAPTVNPGQCQRLVASLKEFLPNTEVTVVGGVEQILVVEGDAA